MRCGPIAASLKVNADRVAKALSAMHSDGRLVRCLVTVPSEEKLTGARGNQWEYKLPAGLLALPEAKPYKAPKAYRREANNVRATQAVSGGNNHGSHACDSVVDGGPRTDPPSQGVAVVEQPKPDDLPVEARSDEKWFFRWVSSLVNETETPGSLAECKGIIQDLIDGMLDYIAEKDARIASLESNRPLDLDAASLVNHPAHYNAGEIECIDAIRSALGREGFIAFCRGNSIKYNWRAGLKGDAAQDMAKAAWYSNKAKEAA